MSDLQLLLAVLLAFHVWENTHWIRRPGLVFRSWFSARCRCVVPAGASSNRLGGIVLANPLPGAGLFFAVQWPPVVFSVDAVIAHRDPLDWRDDIPPSATARQPLDSIQVIEIRRHEVWLDGRRFVAAGSPAGARALGLFIKRLKSAEPSARSRLIEDWLHSMFDQEFVRTRIAEWRRSTGALAFFCSVEFLLVVLAMVWLFRGLTLTGVWLPFLTSLLIVNVIATVLFVQAHRRLHPDGRDERIQHATMMSVFPLATIPAVALLGRHLVEGQHPLAVAAEVAGRVELERLARRHLRRLRVWREHAPAEQRPFYRQLEQAVVGFLRGHKLDPSALLTPPEPNDPECHSFCPRCEGQFTFTTGQCTACGSIPTQPLQGGSRRGQGSRRGHI